MSAGTSGEVRGSGSVGPGRWQHGFPTRRPPDTPQPLGPGSPGIPSTRSSQGGHPAAPAT